MLPCWHLPERRRRVTTGADHDLGYTEIFAGLAARFGTRFGLETVGDHTAMVATFEGGIKVKICDCGDNLSSVGAHLDGRANGYYVGVHRAVGTSGSHIDAFGQLGYAMDVEAPPTAEAIGDLIHQAFEWAQFLREEETKSRGSL
jgi:predicted SpoU family rRNA methylase